MVPDALLRRGEAGDAKGQFKIGLLYMRAERWADAKTWLEKAAQQGDPAAKSTLSTVQQRLEREGK